MRRTSRRSSDPALVVGYVRCSTDEQNLGPEAQREALARWCQAHDARLVAVHEDPGVSGGAALDRRPGLLAALDALGTTGAGVLLVAKRDRLARDVVVAAMVERLAERHGARVLTADGTGNGEGPEAMLLRGIVDVFAQYERALIRARTKAALAVKRSRGERTSGHVPYGYRLGADGVHLERDEAEQGVAALARALRDEGRTLRAVAAELAARGLTPRHGRAWHPQSVARLIVAAEAA
jgi:DNA invertase Pin-like site-specific DNA recombinase